MTDCSSLTGVSSTPAASAAFCAAAPHGTSGAQTTSFTSLLVTSESAAMPSGLSGATAIWRVLVAKFSGSWPSRPSAVSFSMLATSAEANTSAGAPSWICAARSDEPPKLNSTSTPSWSASNSSPSCSKVLVSEAAA